MKFYCRMDDEAEDSGRPGLYAWRFGYGPDYGVCIMFDTKYLGLRFFDFFAIHFGKRFYEVG